MQRKFESKRGVLRNCLLKNSDFVESLLGFNLTLSLKAGEGQVASFGSLIIMGSRLLLSNHVTILLSRSLSCRHWNANAKRDGL